MKTKMTVLELVRDLLLYNMTDNVYIEIVGGNPQLFVENEAVMGSERQF